MKIFSSTYGVSDNTTKYAKILEIKKLNQPFYNDSKLQLKFMEINYQHILVSTINVFITKEYGLIPHYADNRDIGIIFSEESDKWSVYVKANYLYSTIACSIEYGAESLFTPHVGVGFKYIKEDIPNKVYIRTSVSQAEIDTLDGGDDSLDVANNHPELRYNNLMVAEYTVSEGRRSELPESGDFVQWRVENIPCYWQGSLSFVEQIWSYRKGDTIKMYSRKYYPSDKTWTSYVQLIGTTGY